MLRLKTAILASAAALALAAAPASAADYRDPVSIATGFDWSGPYANASVVGVFDAFGTLPPMAGGSVTLGVGGTVNQFYFGVEANAGLLGAPGGVLGTLSTDARLGVVVTDSAMIYTLGGIGQIFTAGGTLPFMFSGLGAEFAVTDAMTIRTQYQLNASATLSHAGKVGLSWYF